MKLLREDFVVNLISNDEIIISLNKFKAKIITKSEKCILTTENSNFT